MLNACVKHTLSTRVWRTLAQTISLSLSSKRTFSTDLLLLNKTGDDTSRVVVVVVVVLILSLHLGRLFLLKGVKVKQSNRVLSWLAVKCVTFFPMPFWLFFYLVCDWFAFLFFCFFNGARRGNVARRSSRPLSPLCNLILFDAIFFFSPNIAFFNHGNVLVSFSFLGFGGWYLLSISSFCCVFVYNLSPLEYLVVAPSVLHSPLSTVVIALGFILLNLLSRILGVLWSSGSPFANSNNSVVSRVNRESWLDS